MNFDFLRLGIVLSGANGGSVDSVEELVNDSIHELQLTEEQRMQLLEGVNTGALWGKFIWNDELKKVQHFEGNMN